MTNATREFLGSLKAGDKVVQLRVSRYWGDRLFVYTVERLTATQVVMTNGQRFRLSDGKLIGKEYTYLQMPPSDDVIERIRNEVAVAMRRAGLTSKIRNCDLEAVPLETLEAVVNLLEKPPA